MIPAVLIVIVPELANDPASRFKLVIASEAEVVRDAADLFIVNVLSAKPPPNEKLDGNVPEPSIVSMEDELERRLPADRLYTPLICNVRPLISKSPLFWLNVPET